MSSKTHLPGRILCAQDKDSQRHLGKPDQPCQRRSTQEVQAEKVEKARLLADRERMRSETIQTTAELEKHMEAELKQKLSTAHHPPPKHTEEGATSHSQEVVGGGTFFQK